MGPTTYLGSLLGHLAKSRLREGFGVMTGLVILGRWVFIGLMAVICWMVGHHAETLLEAASLSGRLETSDFLLHGAGLLLGVAVISSDRARLNLSPYRYLPFSVGVLGFAHVLFDGLRLPLLLYAVVMSGLYSGGSLSKASITSGANLSDELWLVGAAALGLSAFISGRQLRPKIIGRSAAFFGAITGIFMLGLVDAAAGFGVVTSLSGHLSAAFFTARPWAVVLSGTLLSVAIVTASFSSANRLRYVDHTVLPSAYGRPQGLAKLIGDDRPVARLAALEMLMLRRCAYPQYQLRGIGLMLIVLLAIIAIMPEDNYDIVTLLFVVLGLAATYLQLAFAWNSEHFDGLFALPLGITAHVRARWIIAVLFTGASGIGACLVAWLFGVGSALAAVACVVFTIGVLTTPLMWFSALRSRSVALSGSALGNMQAFSWQLYPVGIGLWVGTQVLLFFTSELTLTILYLAAGAFGVLLQSQILRHVADSIRTRLPEMAERLRTST